eukprot:TRINITY_DN29430_c0_g1_i1.p1 TRINITY_DN29430_c0_g1~~TRINITY_DN29430_c0_g1_i1.p1  ORF type:complete len:854 (+),score=166.19 TRINITY_DN29430_c0_g1_i1:94-2562(+)
MAGRRPGAGGSPKSDFVVGASIEYYSKSYDEWVPAVIGVVRPDGNLKLLHDDGTVLKEQADPSLCRVVPSEAAALPPAGVIAGRAPAGGGPRSPNIPPRGRAPSPAPKVGAVAGGVPPRRSVAGAGGGGARAPSPALVGAGRGLMGGGGGGAAAAAPVSSSDKADNVLAKTLNPSKFYVGDRVKIKESGREGDVMYIGTPSFSSKEVIGMKLDEKRSKSECDGKAPNGERLFRCTPGYGIFLPSEDCEILPPENTENFRGVPAPDGRLDLSESLADFVGLTSAKQQILKVQQIVEVQKKREALGVHGGRLLHFFFRGNHGCGMSSVAQLVAHLLRDLEVIASGQLLEVSRKELLTGSSDVDKQMSKMWRAAAGGVLLVNDAHTFIDRERSRDSEGQEASEFLAKQVNNMAAKSSGENAGPCFPQSVCVILACPQDAVLPEPLQKIQAHVIDFPDYQNDELVEILMRLVVKRKFSLAPNLTAGKLLPHVRDAACRVTDSQCRNMLMLQTLLDEAIARQTERAWNAETVSLHGLTTLVEEDFIDSLTPSRDEAIKEALAKLDRVVGLANVKQFIRSLHAQLKIEAERREAGIAISGGAGTLHMIFSGNPGTGKTTVARIVAELLTAMGLLRKGHLVEADRATLVAGYSGQTALKTRQVVDQAMGGVLFVDEAYALVAEDGKDAFGKEALDTLIKMIEDRRQDLVVILAGYPDEMDRLVSTNPGVRSRFPTQVLFDDYSQSELMSIATQMLSSDGFSISPAASKTLCAILAQVHAAGGREQGNGRAVRNILEQARRKMAVRLQSGASVGARSKGELSTMEPADFE